MHDLELLLQKAWVVDAHLLHALVVAASGVQGRRDCYLALRVTSEVREETSQSMSSRDYAHPRNMRVLNANELAGSRCRCQIHH